MSLNDTVLNKKGLQTSSTSPSMSSSLVDMSPSVLAMSNLRCPSPPPILNKSNKNPQEVLVVSLIDNEKLIPVSSNNNSKGKNQESSHLPEITNTKTNPIVQLSKLDIADALNSTEPPIQETVQSENNSTLNINYLEKFPEKSIHHKTRSVHAHFDIDESLKPSKLSNRSRSSSAASSDIPKPNGPVLSECSKSSNRESKVAPKEQNTNIDPRLPQDDGKIHVLFGVCGALPIGKIKLIINKLIEIYSMDKISIQMILTRSCENFISPECLNYLETQKEVRIWRDSDEWNTWKARLDPVLHIELRRWADILVICPLTANTLSKISLGLCDNLLTNVIRAWNTTFPILLAPAMISHSYNAVTTRRQLRLIAEEMPWIEILKPVEKVFGSYGDIGMGGMMDWNEIGNKIVLKLGGYPEEEDDDSDMQKQKDAQDEDKDDQDEDDQDEDDEDDEDEEDYEDEDEDDEDEEEIKNKKDSDLHINGERINSLHKNESIIHLLLNGKKS